MGYTWLELMKAIYLNVIQNGAHFLCKNLKLTKCPFIELIIISTIQTFTYRAVVIAQLKYGRTNLSKHTNNVLKS